MKKIVFFLILISTPAWADINNPLTIQEEDGSPTGQPYAVKFSNATVTDNGDGTFSITNTGGSGTPGGATTQVQFNDGGSFGGDVSFSWNKTLNTLGISRDAAQTGFAIVISSDTGITLAGISHDGASSFTTVDTGQGANELYDMNQNVQTTDSPTFAGLTLSSPLTVANGGTGAATHTDGGLLIGKGTGAIENTGVLAKGTLVVGDGTTNPTTFTAGANGTFLSYDSSTASGLTTGSLSSYDRAVVVEMTDGATITPNLDLGKTFRVTLGGNRTLGTPINGTHGRSYIFIISQDSAGSRTLSYSGFYRFGSDVPRPILSTTALSSDYIGMIYQIRGGKTSMDVVSVAKGYAD